jgi:hypothetical protein
MKAMIATISRTMGSQPHQGILTKKLLVVVVVVWPPWGSAPRIAFPLLR